MAQTPFPFDQEEIHLTVSLGVAAPVGPDRLTVDQFLVLADQQLYQAKRAGRNCTRPVRADGGTFVRTEYSRETS